MLGKINPYSKNVHIIGGGISGLLAAYHLDRIGYKVSLYEKNIHSGGIINTHQTYLGWNETSAHSIRNTPAVSNLFQELNLKAITLNSDSAQRYLYRKGQISKVPLKLHEFIPLFVKSRFKPKNQSALNSEASIEKWATQRFSQKMIRYVLAPVIQNTFSAQPHELNLEAATPFLKEANEKSLVDTELFQKNTHLKPHLLTVEGGMSELAVRLCHHLKKKLEGRLHLDTQINELPSEGNVILCTPAYEAARLLSPEDSELADSLANITYLPLMSISVFTRIRDFGKRPEGMNVFFPEVEKKPFLSLGFQSNAFPNSVKSPLSFLTITGLMGGSQNQNVLSFSDSEVEALLRKTLEELYDYDGELFEVKVSRWKQAIPLYSNDLLSLWKIAQSSWCSKPGRLLFSNYTGQMSIRGLIESSQQLRFHPPADMVPVQLRTEPKKQPQIDSPLAT